MTVRSSTKTYFVFARDATRYVALRYRRTVTVTRALVDLERGNVAIRIFIKTNFANPIARLRFIPRDISHYTVGRLLFELATAHSPDHSEVICNFDCR